MTRRRPPMTLTTLEDRWTPAAAGTLDPTFGVAGFAQFVSTPELSGFQPSALAAYPDGRFVVCGPKYGQMSDNGFPYYVARYTPAGKLDTTFGTGGYTTIPGRLDVSRALAVDPAGRVVLGAVRAMGLTVVRVTADGNLDAGFGTNGVATIPISVTASQSATVSAFGFQTDGRIVVVGQDVGATGRGQVFPDSIAVGRFSDAGQADASFGTGGEVTLPYPLGEQNQAFANAVAIRPDGRIVVAGGAAASKISQAFVHITYALSDAVVVSMNSDGQLDPTFGNGGRATLATPGVDDPASRLRILPDGGVLIGGGGNSYATGSFGSYSATPTAFSARFTADGNPDSTYGTSGRVDLPGMTNVIPLADGRALLATNTTLGRLTTTGQLEPGFGGDSNNGVSVSSGGISNPAVVLGDGGLLIAVAYSPAVPSSSGGAARFAGTTTLFPAPAGTLTLGGALNGSVTPLLSDASGALTPVAALSIYRNFPGSVRTAMADVNGDGVLDLITGPGPGGGPNVVVTDGKTGAAIANLNAFETTFTGGVFVAAADLNGDGKAEVVVTPDQGGGPVVAIYDGAGLTAGKNEAAQLVRFFGIDDEAFRGGARPALGDINGDGKPDLVVAAGFGGGPRVALYDGPRTADRSQWLFARSTGIRGLGPAIFLPPKLTGDFFVFEPTLRNGVFVAAGDLNGDGKAEVVVGGGPGGGPRVMALDGLAVLGGQQIPVVNFFAGDAGSRGGVRVAVRPAADGSVQLVTGSGEGQPGRVNVYKAATAVAGGPADQVISPFGDAALVDGVFVG